MNQTRQRPRPSAYALRAARITLLAILLCAPSSYGNPTDEVVKIHAEGFAPGHGSGASTRAIAAAEKDAVTLFLGTLLGAQDLAAAKPILDRAKAYIRSTRVIKLERTDGGTHMSVEVYLFNQALRNDLAALLFPRLPKPPRVLIFVTDRIGAGASMSIREVGTAEKALIDAFRDTGFETVDSQALRTRYTSAELLERLRGGHEAAGKFGRENGADVVILGEATARIEAQGAPGRIGRCRASVDLRVIRAANGEPLDARRAEAAVHGNNLRECAAIAIRDAAKKLEKTIMVAATLAMAGAPSENSMSLTIQAPTNRRDVEHIVEILALEPEVHAVELLRIEPDSALIRLDYSGKMSTLVKRLASPNENGAYLEPIRVIDNHLVFRFVRP